MTLVEMIKMTGQVPNKMTSVEGDEFELFIRKRTGNKGYIASFWQIVNKVQEHIVVYGEGKTSELAKEDIKNKIFNL